MGGGVQRWILRHGHLKLWKCVKWEEVRSKMRTRLKCFILCTKVDITNFDYNYYILH